MSLAGLCALLNTISAFTPPVLSLLRHFVCSRRRSSRRYRSKAWAMLEPGLPASPPKASARGLQSSNALFGPVPCTNAPAWRSSMGRRAGVAAGWLLISRPQGDFPPRIDSPSLLCQKPHRRLFPSMNSSHFVMDDQQAASPRTLTDGGKTVSNGSPGRGTWIPGTSMALDGGALVWVCRATGHQVGTSPPPGCWLELR